MSYLLKFHGETQEASWAESLSEMELRSWLGLHAYHVPYRWDGPRLQDFGRYYTIERRS